MKNPLVSIIIPAYNEEKIISKSLSTINKFVASKSYASEIIVVDDGSTDKTASVVRQIAKRSNKIKLISHSKNQGKGAAIRTGMLVAKGKFRIFSDADLSMPFWQIDKLLAEATAADIVIGSRAICSSNVIIHPKYHRVIISRIFNLVAQMLVLYGIKDTQCGFKLFSERAAKKIFSLQRVNGFGFDIETLYIARKLGFSIKEIPIEWIPNTNSTVRIIRDSLRIIAELLSIRLNDILGRYSQKQSRKGISN